MMKTFPFIGSAKLRLAISGEREVGVASAEPLCTPTACWDLAPGWSEAQNTTPFYIPSLA